MKKYIQYPRGVDYAAEKFAVVLNQESAGGSLSMGLISQDTWNGYTPVTCPKVKMPFCQAIIVRDSDRFRQNLPQILAENGMGKVIGESQLAGFRGYSIFEFNPDVLRDIDPEVFAAYERASQFQEKAPICFEKQNIQGVEWSVAMQDIGGKKEALAASATGNPNAPILVAPENGSYVLFAQGDSPQSYGTMNEAISHGCAMIHSLPKQERDAYLVHPSGKEGIYQLEDGEYSINAYWSHLHPGMISTEILNTQGLMDKHNLDPDDLPFDEDPLLYDLHDKFLNIEECVQHVAGEFLGKENSKVEFVAPCDHPLETVSDYREAMRASPKHTASLDDLMKKAKAKVAGKDSPGQHMTQGHKEPEREG